MPDAPTSYRDIEIFSKDKKLKKISEFNPAYLTL